MQYCDQFRKCGKQASNPRSQLAKTNYEQYLDVTRITSVAYWIDLRQGNLMDFSTYIIKNIITTDITVNREGYIYVGL